MPCGPPATSGPPFGDSPVYTATSYADSQAAAYLCTTLPIPSTPSFLMESPAGALYPIRFADSPTQTIYTSRHVLCADAAAGSPLLPIHPPT